MTTGAHAYGAGDRLVLDTCPARVYRIEVPSRAGLYVRERGSPTTFLAADSLRRYRHLWATRMGGGEDCCETCQRYRAKESGRLSRCVSLRCPGLGDVSVAPHLCCAQREKMP